MAAAWSAAESATVRAWRCTNLTRMTSWSRAVRRCGYRGGPGAPGGCHPLAEGRRAGRPSSASPGIVGLAAGYALGGRPLRQTVRLSPTAPSRAAVAGAVPSTAAGFAAPVYPPPAPGGPAYSSSLGITGLSGLAQTGGACSVKHGSELQVGVEVINLSDTSVTLGRARPVLPHGGLSLVSEQWAPCGALSPSWQAADGGMIVFVKSSTGVLEAGSTTPASGGPAAERHCLAERHLPGAGVVPDSAAAAVQRQLPGERADGHRAAGRLAGPGAGRGHRLQGQLLGSRPDFVARTIPEVTAGGGRLVRHGESMVSRPRRAG